MRSILILSGSIGSGKTSVAAALAERYSAVHLASDALRSKRGHGFNRMGRALDDARARGKRIILDSTGMSFRFQALIARVRTQAVHVHLSVDVEQWKAREQTRRDRALLGEDVYRRSSEIAFESPPDLVVDTSRLTVDEVVDRVAKAWEQSSP